MPEVLSVSLLLALLLLAGLLLMLVVGGIELVQRASQDVGSRAGGLLRRPGRDYTKLMTLAARYLEEHDEQRREALRKKLFQAGFSGAGASYYFTLSKLGAGLVAIALVVVLLFAVSSLEYITWANWLIFPSLAFLVGYSAPGVLIDSWSEQYKNRIAKGLPDALDLMLVCVEAGQSLDLSLVRVAKSMRKIHPELAERFAATSEALKAGDDRNSAFERLAYETDNADIKAFARLVLQSSAMGTPVAETFRVFSADQRMRRMARIEEKANVLPTKMTLGTMFFTVPPFLLLMLAPPIYSIVNSF